MSEECNHDCASCGEDCGERSLLAQANPESHVKKVIGVVSGKGGVGKSMVTSLLACAMQKKGYQAAVLDADITGPSIPRMFGVSYKVVGNENGLIPATAENGTRIMSVNLLLPNETDPVVWRGPIIANTVKQFWTDVCWGEIDYMFVDMPPGTGDVPLTVFQSLPIDGIIVVTSPQELVGMIVEKAVKMAGMTKTPVLGLVENMAYFECPSCHEKHQIFGSSHIDELAAKHDIQTAVQLPINPALAAASDNGKIAEIDASDWLDELTAFIEAKHSTK